MLTCSKCRERPVSNVKYARLCDPCSRICTKCNTEPRSQRSRYCLPCKALYMRNWRKTTTQSDEAKLRATCRSYANVYLKRGKIERRGCEVCGEPAQMHHDDYSKPLEVRWFCRRHHIYLHHP